MKQKVNPMMAMIAVVAVVVVAGLFIWKASSSTTHAEGEKPPGMPADVAKEFQQRLGGTTGPGAPSAPTGGTPAGPGGYIAPPTH